MPLGVATDRQRLRADGASPSSPSGAIESNRFVLLAMGLFSSCVVSLCYVISAISPISGGRMVAEGCVDSLRVCGCVSLSACCQLAAAASLAFRTLSL